MAGRPKGGLRFGPSEDAYLESMMAADAARGRPKWREVARELGRPEIELLRRVSTLQRRRNARRAKAMAEANTRPCSCCGRPFVRTPARRMLCADCFRRGAAVD